MICVVLTGGCGHQAMQAEMQQAELRIAQLEKKTDELDRRLTILSESPYEVRTRAGDRKTGLVAIPGYLPSPAELRHPGGGDNAPAVQRGLPSGAVPSAVQRPAGRAVPARGRAVSVPSRPHSGGVTPAAVHPFAGKSTPSPSPRSLAQPPLPGTPASRAGDAQAPFPDLAGLKTLNDGLSPSREDTTGQLPAATAAAPSSRTEKQEYEAALALVLRGRNAEAIAAFRQFLQQYPGGRFAPNAEYWTGEALYSQGRYAEALEHFLTVSSRYPRHHKSADAMLKAGMTLNRLGNRPGARRQYAQVLARFPASEAAGTIRARRLGR